MGAKSAAALICNTMLQLSENHELSSWLFKDPGLILVAAEELVREI